MIPGPTAVVQFGEMNASRPLEEHPPLPTGRIADRGRIGDTGSSVGGVLRREAWRTTVGCPRKSSTDGRERNRGPILFTHCELVAQNRDCSVADELETKRTIRAVSKVMVDPPRTPFDEFSALFTPLDLYCHFPNCSRTVNTMVHRCSDSCYTIVKPGLASPLQI